MKVALVHDVFIDFGGAERVLLAIQSIFPTADVFIPLLSDKGRGEVESHTSGLVFSSLLNNLPFVHSASILLKPLLYLYWEQLVFRSYDLVISSSHSFSSKSVITPPTTVHISYIHTPPRYLYTEYNETQVLQKPFIRILLSPLLSWLRTKDYLGAQRPDVIIANSKTVQARVKKYYRRESHVIYPPVQIPKLIKKRKPAYFVCVSRLVKQKGIDLAIKTCSAMHERLIIVGEGGQEAYLRSIAGPTIEFRGRVPDGKMSEVWSGAKALIYPAIEEDFGITPVEAMSYGIPVVAFSSGATTETVIENKTGIFFNEFTNKSLTDALKKFSHTRFDHKYISKHAKTFSEERFTREIRKLVNAYV